MSEEKQDLIVYKIPLDGAGKSVEEKEYKGPGASSILNRLTQKTLNEKYDSTIGVEFTTLQQDNVVLQIWDTATQRDRRIQTTNDYYRNANLLVFCIEANDSTWQNKFERWKSNALKIAPKETPIVLLATKSDLPYDPRNVKSMEEYAAKNKINFFITSAKNNTYQTAYKAPTESLSDNLMRKLYAIMVSPQKIPESEPKSSCTIM